LQSSFVKIIQVRQQLIVGKREEREIEREREKERVREREGEGEKIKETPLLQIFVGYH